MLSQRFARMFHTTARRMNEPGGIAGVNLPFDIHSGPLKITIIFAIYMGSGIAAPFLMVKHQLTK